MKSTAKLRYDQAKESGNKKRAEALAKKYPHVLEQKESVTPSPEKETKSKGKK